MRTGVMAGIAAAVMLAAPAMGVHYYSNGSDGNYTNGVGNAGSPWRDDGQGAGTYPDSDDEARFTYTNGAYTVTVTGIVTADWIRAESGDLTLHFPSATDMLVGKMDSPAHANGRTTITGPGTNSYAQEAYFGPAADATVVLDNGNVIHGVPGYEARNISGTVIISNNSYFGALQGCRPRGGSTIIVDGPNSWHDTAQGSDHKFGMAGNRDVIVRNGARYDHSWMEFPSTTNAGGTILITDPGTEWDGEGGGSHVTFGHASGTGSVTVRVANAAVMTCGKAPENVGGVGFENNSTLILDDASFGFCSAVGSEYMTVFSNATLTGNGLLFEIADFNSTLFMTGTLAPGLSVGTITAKVNVVNMLETSSILQAELTSTTSYDQFVVTDAGNPTTVNLDSDARVEVTPLNPETFTLKAGDTFDLIVADDVDVSGGLPSLSFQGPEAASFAGTLTEVAGTPEALRLTLTAAPVPPPTGTVFKVR